jgi:hypothetical protein
MNQAEFSNYFFRQQFKLACYEKKGDEFQNFFANIMEKSDDSFVSVSAAGRLGDKKCDGYSEKTATVFQCYSPDNIEKDDTIKSAIKKIKDDFAGVKKHWFTDKSDWMKRWVFVWNGKPKALPADILQALLKVKDAEKEIEIDNWNVEKLWTLIESFSLPQKTDLFGIVPAINTVTEITAAEVSVLLEFLAKQESKEQTDDLDLLGISEKLEKNKFSLYMQGQIKICLPMTEFIDGYLSKHPDAEFQEKIADVIVEKYKQFSENSVNSDDVIYRLIKYVQSPKEDNEKYFFAATGIVAHYFHLCDIFEK